MKAKVTRIFTFNDKQIKEFMESKGYVDEDAEYTEEDVDNELDNAEAWELEEYGDCDFLYGHDIDIDD